MSNQLSHIYTGKRYLKGSVKIKILCSGENILAEDRGRHTGKWFVSNKRQWSIGAGHNSDCKDCLIEWGKLTSRKITKVFSKLES